MNVRHATVLDWVPAPARIAHGRQWASVQRLASELGDIAASYYIECRTGEDSERVDLLVSISRGRRQAFHTWLANQRAPLAPLRRLSAAWNEGSGPFPGVSGLWLEYDQVDRAIDTTSPCVSVCLVPNYNESLVVEGQSTVHGSLGAVSEVVETVLGSRLPGDAVVKLEQCLSALPNNGRVIHVSLMLGRPDTPLKLYCVVPRRAVGGFLANAGWRGPTSLVTELVERYCTEQRVADEVYCDVTVSDIDRPGGNIFGVVFTPQHLLRAKERQPGREPLLSECLRAGLCSQAQRDELVEWPDRRLTEVDWAHEPALMVVERWLDVKLVWAPSSGVSLKAYLGLSGRGANAFDRVNALAQPTG